MQRFKTYRVIGIAIAAAALSACSSNGVAEREQAIKTEWHDVQTELQQRNDLIPGLVDQVKSSASNDDPVFQALAESRARLAGAKTPEDTMAAGNQQSSALVRLMAFVEHYPQLKTNGAFNRLMEELRRSEIRVAVVRMRYNAQVQQYNTIRRQLPGVLTGIFKPDYPFFEVPTSDRAKQP